MLQQAIEDFYIYCTCHKLFDSSFGQLPYIVGRHFEHIRNAHENIVADSLCFSTNNVVQLGSKTPIFPARTF